MVLCNPDSNLYQPKSILETFFCNNIEIGARSIKKKQGVLSILCICTPINKQYQYTRQQDELASE